MVLVVICCFNEKCGLWCFIGLYFLWFFDFLCLGLFGFWYQEFGFGVIYFGVGIVVDDFVVGL